MRKSHRPRISGNQQKSRPKSGCIPFESLETRTLLSAATSTVFATSPFSFNPPLSSTSLSRTPTTSTNLRDLKNGPMANAPDLVNLYIEYRQYIANGGNPSSFVSKQAPSDYIQDGKVLVTVRGLRGATTLATMLTSLGSTISAMNGQYGTVDASVPIIDLKKVSRSIQVASLSPIGAGMFATAGSANNQADETEMADLVRSTYGLDGTGVKVGVLSDSVNQVGGGLGSSVATGDLPAGVQVIEDSPFTVSQITGEELVPTDEGRAMLELIHDIAPGAALAFATANGGQQHFADNISALAAAGCNVIVDDLLGFAYAEPFFQPSVADQAIAKFVQGGGVYLSCAGNSSDGAIQQSLNWVNVGGKTFNDFDPGPGVSTRMNISVSGGEAILEWDNPYNGVTGNATSDLDIYFYDQNHPTHLVASATTNNLQTHLPVEEVVLPAGDYQMQIRLVASTSGQPLPTLYELGGSYGLTSAEFAGARTPIEGHNGGPNTISVGAVPFYVAPPYDTSPSSESFSSDGPVTQIFDADGNRLPTVATVLKPDISGIDGTNTSFFVGDTGTFPQTPVNPVVGLPFPTPPDLPDPPYPDPDPFPNFFGTSAAAPNVAAVVALILQEKPGATQAQIVSALKATATPLNSALVGTYDPQGGFGLVNAYAAIQQFIQAPTVQFAPVSPNPSATGISKIKVSFSQQVSGFDVSELNLHEAGGPNLLTGNNSPVSTDGGRTWIIPNLQDVTSDPATYEIDLEDDLHAIVNAVGLPLQGGASTQFTVQGSNGVPDAPSNLSAQAITSTSVQLKWTDNSLGETGFTLQRAETPKFTGKTLKSITIAANKTSYIDTLPAATGKIYYYRIRAFGGGSDVSSFSNTARVVSLASGQIVLDNSTSKGVAVSGPWVLNTNGGGFLGNNYLDDLNTNKGKDKVVYTPVIQTTGDYYVYARWVHVSGQATNVPITVSANGKAKTFTVNERNTGGAGWILLGKFHLAKGSSSFVSITNKGTNGRVTADAVEFQPTSA